MGTAATVLRAKVVKLVTRTIWIAPLILALSKIPGAAEMDGQQRVLRGLNSLRVQVSMPAGDVPGIRIEDLDHHVKSYVRAAGIETHNTSPSAPVLYVFVNLLPMRSTKLSLFMVALELREKVTVSRLERGEHAEAALWEKSDLSYEEDWFVASRIRRELDYLLSEFVSDYRKANSSGQQSNMSTSP